MIKSSDVVQIPHEEWNQVLPLLEEEFYRAKKKSGSIKERIPEVGDAAGRFTLWGCRVDEQWISAILEKSVEVDIRGQRSLVSLVGFVWVDAAYRGQSRAADILLAIEENALAEGKSAMVLWTTMDGFYERYGWRCLGEDVLTICPGTGRASDPRVLGENISEFDIEAVENLRGSLLNGRPIRNHQDYQVCPPPAEQIKIIWLDKTYSSYVIFGLSKRYLVLYELAGQESLILPFLQDLPQKSDREIWFNRTENVQLNASQLGWKNAVCQRKPLSRWKILDGKIQPESLRAIAFTLQDRI